MSNEFKAIVVGSGPVGLISAHALSKSGFDFIVLEGRDEIITNGGTDVVLSVMGLNALDQLGLSVAVSKVSTPLPTFRRIDDSGRDLGTAHFFEFHKRDHGMYPVTISRHDLTRILYESLPPSAQAKILPRKRVSEIQTTADGATVTCKDGTSYPGTIVVGADGAHSIVRSQMRSLALAAGSSRVNAEKPYLTTYQCLWMRFPSSASDDLHTGLASETHSHGACVQVFAGKEIAVAGIYETLPSPTRDRLHFGQAEEEALIARRGHLPVTEGARFTMADAYRSRIASGMVSLEEGVVEHWSHNGRLVLVGDAKHKFTPITGAGCNNGLQDVVALVNELHKAFESASVRTRDGRGFATPERTEITEAFEAYQRERFVSVKAQCAVAGRSTATATWSSIIAKIIDQYVMGHKIVQKQIWPKKAGSPRFFFSEQDTPVQTAAAL
ncbi:FAD/NAD(P)-binding domain-containing protein [Astrocystis sublimbata]|nr:FAD/NAD(P)-binding domain-containing protein [Astrocystis sublimbata]